MPPADVDEGPRGADRPGHLAPAERLRAAALRRARSRKVSTSRPSWGSRSSSSASVRPTTWSPSSWPRCSASAGLGLSAIATGQACLVDSLCLASPDPDVRAAAAGRLSGADRAGRGVRGGRDRRWHPGAPRRGPRRSRRTSVRVPWRRSGSVPASLRGWASPSCSSRSTATRPTSSTRRRKAWRCSPRSASPR